MHRTQAPDRRLRRRRFADSTGRPRPPDRSRRRVWAVRPTGLRTVAAAAVCPSEATAACIDRSPAAPPSSRSCPAHTCRMRPGGRACHPRIAHSTGCPTPPDRCHLSAVRLVAQSAAPSTTNRGKIPALVPRALARPAHGRAIHGAAGTRRKVCPRPARNETMRSASQAKWRGARARRLERIAPQGCPPTTLSRLFAVHQNIKNRTFPQKVRRSPGPYPQRCFLKDAVWSRARHFRRHGRCQRIINPPPPGALGAIGAGFNGSGISEFG
jgi:hypothetical protein